MKSSQRQLRYALALGVTAGVLIMVGQTGEAGGLTLPPQPVVPPADTQTFSWSGPYMGVVFGTTKRKYRNKVWNERDIIERGQDTRPYNKTDLWNELQETGCDDPHREYEIDYVDFGFGYTTDCQSIVNSTPYEGWDYGHVVGHDPVVVNEWERVVGTERWTSEGPGYSKSHSTWGLLFGARHQFENSVVLGAEAGVFRYNGVTSIETKGQFGYALGRFLPYATAGFDFDVSEPLYGAGVAYAITDNWIATSEYTHSKTRDRAFVGVAYKF